MSEEKRVRIADGSQDTQDRLHSFLRTQKKAYPEKKLRSLESAILFAMSQAELVPVLQKEIEQLRAKAWEEHCDNVRLQDENQKMKFRLFEGKS